MANKRVIIIRVALDSQRNKKKYEILCMYCSFFLSSFIIIYQFFSFRESNWNIKFISFHNSIWLNHFPLLFSYSLLRFICNLAHTVHNSYLATAYMNRIFTLNFLSFWTPIGTHYTKLMKFYIEYSTLLYSPSRSEFNDEEVEIINSLIVAITERLKK